MASWSGANQRWTKSHFEDDLHHGVWSQPHGPGEGPICLGDLIEKLVQRDFLKRERLHLG